MANSKILELNETNFAQAIRSGKPILVDFWASWCGPCRMVAPVLEELADEHDDVVIGKVNVDDNQELAVRFGVQSIPTFLLFKDGEVADRMMGAMPKSAFTHLIARNLSTPAVSNA